MTVKNGLFYIYSKNRTILPLMKVSRATIYLITVKKGTILSNDSQNTAILCLMKLKCDYYLFNSAKK